MLQRLVKSTVSTDPRPCVMVDVPWSCSFSSLWARWSRPGNTSSRCLENAGSMDITSSNWPWMAHSFTIMILPSRSMMLRLDLADLLVLENLYRQLAVENLLADLRDAAGTQRIRLARPAQRRLLLLPALEQRLVRPLGNEPGVAADRIQLVKNEPGGVRPHGNGLLYVLDRLVSKLLLLFYRALIKYLR